MKNRLSRENINKINLLVQIIIIIGVVVFIGFLGSKNISTIKIATKPMTEQYILGEMMKLLIEEKSNLKVELTKGIAGGTAKIHPAIINNKFDMYFEYTGTSWLYILKKEPLSNDSKLYEELQKIYLNEFELTWVGLYGFNNSYGLAVKSDIAEKYKLETYSDLSKVADKLVFGAETDFFEREDGFIALTDAYNLNFKNSKDLKIEEKYDALNKNTVDVLNIFTTDGGLSDSNIKILKDDKRFYQTYFCGNVVRSDTLKSHPELFEILMLMNGIISDDDMSKMNYLVESGQKQDFEVAREFLKTNGLIK